MFFEFILIAFFLFLMLNFFTSSLLAERYNEWQLSSDFLWPSDTIYFFLIPVIKLGSIRWQHVRVQMGLDKVLVISLTLNFFIGFVLMNFIHRKIKFIISLFLVIFVVDKFEVLWQKKILIQPNQRLETTKLRISKEVAILR